VDYTKFLGKKEELVLAYLGGAHVFGKDRRLRVVEPRPSLGFCRFEVRGRDAASLGAADPVLDGLPKANGHHAAGFVFHGGGVERLALAPEEEIAPFAKVRARRWWSGDWIFESLDFDTEVEEEARLRLERGEALGDLSGVPATLRSAFGVATMLHAARRAQIPLAVREALPHGVRVAEEPGAADAILAAIVRERTVAERRAIREAIDERDRERVRAILARAPAASPSRARRARERPTMDNAVGRAEDALDAAAARMLSTRRLGGDRLEVAFTFLGERFVSVVDGISLQVLDAGVCLAGEDDLVTLDSLPGVIREAIDSGRLVITRR
jgi:hypothetical protein